MNKSIASLLIVGALAATGCKTRQQTTTTQPAPPAATTTQTATQPAAQPQLTAAQVAATQGAWTTMKCGGEIELSGGRSFASGMQMRMERGKSIYISVRPLLGIEAVRMVITGDTILVVDKLHKRYILEDVSLITGGVPVTVEALQDIFLGRVHLLGHGTITAAAAAMVSISAAGSDYLIEPTSQFRGFTYRSRMGRDRRVKSLDVKPATGGAGATTYSVAYSDVMLTVAGNIAATAQIASQIKGRDFSLELHYDNMKWNEKVAIDAAAPAGYSRIDGKDLLNLF